MKQVSGKLSALAPAALAAIATLGYLVAYEPLLDGHRTAMGADYSEFLPRLLGEYEWFRLNGYWSIPWFTPAFCGGMPEWANPQAMPYSLPQALVFFVDPVRAVQITFAVCALAAVTGMWFLLRRGFGTSPTAAALGAVIFLFNGFFSARMLVGHLALHGFMLAPWVAYLLIRSTKTRRGEVASTVGAGVLIAAMIHSGALVVLPPMACAWIAIGLLLRMRSEAETDPLPNPPPRSAPGRGPEVQAGETLGSGAIRLDDSGPLPGAESALLAPGARGRGPEGTLHLFLRFVGAVTVGVLLSASKLVAMSALATQFPRDFYPLPGFRSIGTELAAFFDWLFLRGWHDPSRDLVDTFISQKLQEQHYGVSPVPLVLLAIAPLVKHRSSARPRHFVWMLAALILILALPVALNLHVPGWTSFLKNLPIIRSSSSLTRWLVLYIPLLALGAGLAMDRARAGTSLALAGIVGVLAWNVTANRDAFGRVYQPKAIVKTWNAVNAGGPVPAIAYMDVPLTESGEPRRLFAGDDDVAVGAGAVFCLDPLFGYELEKLPWKPLRTGPPLAAIGGVLNVKNPICELYPAENHCKAGDQFRPDQLDAATAFVSWSPLPFERPLRQRVADLLNLIALAGVVIVLGVALSQSFTDRVARSDAPS